MLIDKEDAIQAVCEACYMYKYIGEHYKDCKYYPCDDVTALESVSEAPKPTGDLISRADAIEAVTDIQDGSGQRYYLAVSLVDKIRSLPSAEAEDRLYIKIYADDEPSVKAEKLYQICGETQNREVAEWLKEYFPSADAEWIPCSERLPERDELVLVTYKTTDKIHLCKYIDDGSENPWWSYIDDCCAYNNVVIAWMPLPKPYREDGEA